MMPKKERKLGIDLLRIISMLMIVTLHVLKQGGILDRTVEGTRPYYLAWMLEALCIGAVNCYALISGYVGVNSKVRYHKIAVLWLEVVFYCVMFAAIFSYTIPQETAFATWFNQFCPVYTGAYWYFTAYFVMFFFTPFMNILLNTLSNKQMKALGWGIFILFSLMPTIWQKDVLYLKHGYTVAWLAMLYIIGGIVKKTELEKSVNAALMFIMFIVFSLITSGYKFAAENFKWEVVKNNLIIYTSATVFIASFCLFLFCAKIDIKTKLGKAAVKLFAPYTFGVYLVHTNPFFWDNIFKNWFSDYANYRAIKMLAYVIIAVIGVYLMSTAVEVLRSLLFRLLHIEPALAALENKIRSRKQEKKTE